MLKRKINDTFRIWKGNENRKPLVVMGCRQCGKTFSVLNFAQENYKHVVYLNFFEDSIYKTIFEDSLNVDYLVMMITSHLGREAIFVPGETCLILDEIQECPNARASLKFFDMDGRYDVICTGSLLGIKGYREDVISIPVGYETEIKMYPLDFEEFLWANGITDDIIDFLTKCKDDCIPVPLALHKRMRQLLLEYVVVGGMPDVVSEYINNHCMNIVLQKQRDIINGYRDDMIKYAEENDKAKIRECFDSIPRQLSREYKKFTYSLVRKNARSRAYEGALQWIEDAGIINRCHNLSITELPLDGNSIHNEFKVYMADIGLFISMLEDGTQFDILDGSLLGYKGAIYENLLADIFTKMGRKLYYFHKTSGLEVDFVIRYHGECILVECKASSGNVKSTKTVLKNPEKYHVQHAIKLGDYNVGQSSDSKVLTLPLYMAFLLR